MRAVVFEEPSVGSEHTYVRELEPPVPAADEVVIRVEHAGVNYIDVMARRGDEAYAPAWPFVPGLEVVGTVLGVGGDDAPFVVGDRVAAFTHGGGLAEQVAANHALVVALPEGVEPAVAAAAPLMLSTAMLLVTRVSHLARGETLLMHSAGGGVGTGVAAIARARGDVRLIGTVSSSAKERAAKEAGWDHVLVRDESLSKNLVALAADGADVILDPLGTQMLAFDLEHVAPNGRVVMFGNPDGQVLDDLPPAGRLIGGNVTIGGLSITRLAKVSPQRVAGALREVLAMLAAGQIDLPVTAIDGLDRVAGVHDALSEGRSAGKYVVRVA